MSTPSHVVYGKFQRPDGSVFITSNNVRGKRAQTRWLNAMVRNNAGYKLLDNWTLTDGRGLNAQGERA